MHRLIAVWIGAVILAATPVGIWGADASDVVPQTQLSILHYEAALTPDFERNTMRSHVEAVVRNDAATTVSSIDFDILAYQKRSGVSVTIDRVTQTTGGRNAQLEFSRHAVPALARDWFGVQDVPQYTRVNLAGDLEPQAEARLAFDYTWQAQNAANQNDVYRLIADTADGGKEVYLTVDHTWLPTVAAQPDVFSPPKADWSLEVCVPAGYLSVAPDGKLVGSREHSGLVTSRWESCALGYPQLMIGRYDRLVFEGHAVPVVLYLHKGRYEPNAARSYAAFLGDTYDFYAKLYGPIEKAQMDVVESYVNAGGPGGPSGNGAYLGFIMPSGFLAGGWQQHAGPIGNVHLAAHELAHGWWGYSVTGEGPGERFLTESLAEFSACCLTEKQYGKDWFRSNMALLFWMGRHDDILAGPDGDDVFLAYKKGPVVLNILRSEMGEGVLFEALNAFASKYKNGRATVDDLAHVCNSVSGKDWTGFFRQWLFEAGCPDYQVTSLTSEQAGDIWRTGVTIRNAGKGVVDCALELRMADDTRRETFRVAEGASSVLNYETPAKVLEAVVDPDHAAYQGSGLECKLKILGADDAGDAMMIWRRGVSRELVGDYEGAIADLSQQIANRARPSFSYFRGIAYTHTGNAAAAGADFTAFIDQLLENPQTVLELAAVGAISGNENQQRQQLNEILRKLTGQDIDYDSSSSGSESWNSVLEQWKEWWTTSRSSFRPADSAALLDPVVLD